MKIVRSNDRRKFFPELVEDFLNARDPKAGELFTLTALAEQLKWPRRRLEKICDHRSVGKEYYAIPEMQILFGHPKSIKCLKSGRV